MSMAFGQKSTREPTKNEIISWALRQGMKDRLKARSLQEQNKALSLSLSNKSSLADKLQEFNLLLQGRNRDMTLRWNEAMKQNDILQEQNKTNIEQYQKALKQANHKKTWNTILGIGSGAALGFLLGAILTH